MSTPDAPNAATTTPPVELDCDADREDNENDEGLEGGVTTTAGSYGEGETGGSKKKREAIDLPPSPAQSLKGDSRTPSSKPDGGGGGEQQPKSKQSTSNDDAAGTDPRRKASKKHTNTGTAADPLSGISAKELPQKRKKPPREETISLKQKQAAAADVPSSWGASVTSSTGGGKSGSNATQSQKERRLAMSRINAQRNRDRKRVIMGMMQEDKKRLTIANAKLKDENELLRVVIATLKQQRAAGATAVAASAGLGVNPMVQGLPLPPQNLYANPPLLSRPAAGPTDLLAPIGLLAQQQQRQQQNQSMGSNSSTAGLLSSMLSSQSSGGNNEAAALPILLALLQQSRQSDSQDPPPSSSIPGSMTQMLSSVGGSMQPAPAESSNSTSNVHAAISEMASTPSGRETLLKLIASGGDTGSNQLQRVLGSGMPGVQQQQHQNSGPMISSQFGWKRSSSSRSDDKRGLTVEQQLQLLNSTSSEQSPSTNWGGVGIQQGGNSMLGEVRSFLSNHAAGPTPSAPGINIDQPQDSSQNVLLQQLLGSMQQGNASAMANSTAQGPAASQQQSTIQSLLSRLGGGSNTAFGPGSG